MIQELDTYPRMVYKIYELIDRARRHRIYPNEAIMCSTERVLIDLSADTNEMFNHDFETLQDALQYIKDNKEELKYRELTVLPVINAR